MRRFAVRPRAMTAPVFVLFLMLLPLLFVPGCGDSGGTEDAEEGILTGGDAAGESGSIAPTKENYVALINRQAQLTREIGQIFQQSLQGGNLEALAAQLNEKGKSFDETWQAIQKLPVPDAELAKELEAGPIKSLDSALEVCKKAKDAYIRRDANAGFITPERLFEAMDYGNATRARILKTIAQEQPKTVAKNDPEPIAPLRTDPPAGNLAEPNKEENEPDPTPPPKAPAEESIRWQVAVDPPSVPYRLEPEQTFELKVPGAGRLPFPAPKTDAEQFANRNEEAAWGVVYPETPSLVVRVGNNQGPKRVSEIWDLGAKKKLGTIRGLTINQSTAVFALSPRGAYFAAQPIHEEVVGVWDVKAAKALGTLKVDDWTGVDFLAFGAEDRLVVIDQKAIKIFSLPSGNLAHHIQVADFGDAEVSVLSPGGRYIIVCTQKSFRYFLEAYDILDGQIKGRIEIGEKAPAGIAFTLDGTKLATFTEKLGNTLRVYSVRRGGNREAELRLPLSADDLAANQNSHYKGPFLSYFPDGKRLLLAGRWIIDAENGRTLATLPAVTNYRLQILADDRLAVLNQNKLVPWEIKETPPAE